MVVALWGSEQWQCHEVSRWLSQQRKWSAGICSCAACKPNCRCSINPKRCWIAPVFSPEIQYLFCLCCVLVDQHHSILYPLNPSVRLGGGLEPIPAVIGREAGPPWTGRQSITGPHRDKQPHTLTPRDNFRATNYLERTCKLHTERWGSNLQPSRYHHTTGVAGVGG